MPGRALPGGARQGVLTAEFDFNGLRVGVTGDWPEAVDLGAGATRTAACLGAPSRARVWRLECGRDRDAAWQAVRGLTLGRYGAAP